MCGNPAGTCCMPLEGPNTPTPIRMLSGCCYLLHTMKNPAMSAFPLCFPAESCAQPPWACRPFLWKGGVYAMASVWGEDSSRVWECILRLDLDAGLLAADFCFDEMPIRTNVTM